MGSCNTSTNCNPCGPDFNTFNQLATNAANYARQSNRFSVDSANSANEAEGYAQDAEDAWHEFNALYLGAFAVAPTTDNEGNPLQTGALYWNSVTNNLWAWDGAAWQLATDFDEFTTFLATGTTTARNLATRFADMANVRDFGATGAGNDIAAFVAASNTGKQVLVPDGTYTITVSNQTEADAIMGMMSRLHLFCNTLTVNLAAGIYTFANRTEFLVTNADKLIITGAATTAFTYSSLVSIVSNGSGDHDVTIALTDATLININDYITIRPTNSITDFAGPFGGIWKVTGKSGNNITFKNTARVASLAGATISGASPVPVNIRRINTILNYNNGTIGIYIRNQLGAISSNAIGFKDIAVVGSGTGPSNIAGVYLEYGASVNLAAEFGIYNFSGNGLYCIYQGVVNASNICVSNCGSNGIYSLSGSVIQIVRAQVTGNDGYGIVASVNSAIAGSQSNASGNIAGYGSVDNSNVTCNNSSALFNQNYGYTCRSVSFCDAVNSRSEYNDFGVEALENSYINFGGTSTVTNNTTYNFREQDGTCYIAGSILPTKSRASKVHDFGIIAGQTIATTTISVPGVAIGDVVAVGWNASDVAGLVITARASATDTVTIYAANITSGNITVGNRTYWVRNFIK
jgi:hypothetical protein